jgi:hypothetical protein
MDSFLDRLKRRKLFQWALAYVATAWLVAQVLDVVAEPWGPSGGLVRTAQALLALGFPFEDVEVGTTWLPSHRWTWVRTRLWCSPS